MTKRDAYFQWIMTLSFSGQIKMTKRDAYFQWIITFSFSKEKIKWPNAMPNFSELWPLSLFVSLSPMRTPTDVEAMDIVKKLHSVEGKVPAVNDSFSWYSRRNVRNSTMATASLSTLSPNTKLDFVRPCFFSVHACCLRAGGGRGGKRAERKNGSA